jgi:hypothetical protein
MRGVHARRKVAAKSTALRLAPLVVFVSLALPTVAARAQTRGAAVPSPAAAGVAAQEIAGQAYYLSLLELYGVQSSAAAPPATRTQIAQAMNEYFTNGAKATGVPTSGPAAAYFTRGAEVSTIATSTIPAYSFAPAFPTAEPTSTDAGPQPPRVEAGAAATPPEGSDAQPPAVPEAPRPAIAPPPPPEAPSAPAEVPTDYEVTAPQPPPPPPESAAAPEPAPAAAPEASFSAAPSLALAAPVEEPPPEPMTRATTILVPMAAGVGIAAFLVAMGLRVRPR